MAKLVGLPALLVLFLLAGLATMPVHGSGSGQEHQRVPVFIGFSQQPGPPEEALVRQAGGRIKHTYGVVNAIAAAVPETAIAGLRNNPRVRYVEPDIEVHLVDHETTSGDAELDNTWGVKHIGSGAVHNGGNTGAGVRVAVLDTGIDTDHPDLGYDAACSNPTSYPSVEDGHGHGTHTGGTVAALDNGVGVVGVGPGATLCVIKVLSDSGGGSYSDVVAALDFIYTYNTVTNPTDPILVTNNSYGSDGNPGETVKAAFDKTYAAGVLHAAAAGNAGNPPGKGDNCIYPARWDSVIATAATKQDDTRASFSSTCAELELAAPGYQVNSTVPGGGYEAWNGTSMASPHVAGTAALVIAAGIGDASGDGNVNDEVRLRLQSTADDLGSAGRDTHYGFGLVDADEAAPPPPPATGSIAGTVTRASDGTAISGATVSVDTGQSATTASDGTYTITDVPTGDRTVTAAADGFESQSKAATVNEDQTTTVDFSLKEAPASTKVQAHVATTEPFTVAKGKSGNVELRERIVVKDSDGNAVAGATVHLTWQTPDGTALGSATTNTSGEVVFSLSGNAPDGAYDSTVTDVTGDNLEFVQCATNTDGSPDESRITYQLSGGAVTSKAVVDECA